MSYNLGVEKSIVEHEFVDSTRRGLASKERKESQSNLLKNERLDFSLLKELSPFNITRRKKV
jgi:hypothetical protein